VVILRGLNVAGDSKVPPFRPVDDAKLLDPFPAWGVNVARLLFTWEAFEPERGSYDASYLDYYESVLDALHARGVWAIVDVHQDAFSRYATSGCGEGMPRWAISSAVEADTPDNGEKCVNWGLQMAADEDTHRSWDDFYADANGVRTRYLALLETLAKRFAEHPAVLGYDMLNEPWGDEPTQLAPLYEEGAALLRKHDPDAILFVSPGALTSAGQETKLPRPGFANFAYAPHYYDGSVVLAHMWRGGSLATPVMRMRAQADTWKVPAIVTEFGGPADATDIGAYVDEFYAQLDARFMSATQWTFVAHFSELTKDGWNLENFSIVDSKGKTRANFRVRPYPVRIAGEPVSLTTTLEPTLALVWKHDPARGATRIFAPRSLFGGATLAEASGLSCAYDADDLHVRCESTSAGEKRVTLRACKAGERCL
jgi:endoglycosylceramidase